MANSFYDRLNAKRNDDAALTVCIETVVKKLGETNTSLGRPGMLLGKIQSGKTRGFLGIIAKAFDEGYDIAVILTKGTKTLSKQTVARLETDFADFISADEVAVYDIMNMPDRLAASERKRKLIIVAKKQVKNLERILKLFSATYVDLLKRKVLLIDDEADLASVRFVRNKETEDIDQGKIAQQMDDLRGMVERLSFLQVTATPYALYLQPDGYEVSDGSNFVFYPKRPAFTELLPIHNAYVGGDDYFGAFDEDDPRGYLFVEVPSEEQDTLRSLDGRSVREDRLLATEKIENLRRSIMGFVTAVAIRRLQQLAAGERQDKYAMVVHNDTQKKAHEWQGQIVDRLIELFADEAQSSGTAFRAEFMKAWDDMAKSIAADGGKMPDQTKVLEMVREAFVSDDIVRAQVNSDNQVDALLDAKAELKLRTPYNIFIGGNILDRGITIPNLICFYYGRNPKRMQADTVLQHSRMYGARNRRDLAVARFYTSRGVYDRLRTINGFEVALRHAFEGGAHDRGVAFIRSDAGQGVVPCSPSKVLLSDIVSVDPGGRLLPVGFQSRAATHIATKTAQIAKMLPSECVDSGTPILVDTELAHRICEKIAETLDTEESGWGWQGFQAVMDYFGRTTPVENHRNKVWLLGLSDRSIARVRSHGRFENSPDTKQQRVIAEKFARDIPILMLFAQEGAKEKGWAGHPFWWPVLIAPYDAAPCVYAASED